MRVPFTYYVPIGNGHTAAEIEGEAIIETSDEMIWRISHIDIACLERRNGSRIVQYLPEDHLLWAPIMMHLLSAQVTAEIDARWREEQWQQLSKAGRRKLEDGGPLHRAIRYGG